MRLETIEVPAKTVGIVGFGAFGRLIAEKIKGDFDLRAYDPACVGREERGVRLVSLEEVAACDIIILAAPVSSFTELLTRIAPLCSPGTLILDVGSVKVHPAEIMERVVPDHVEVIATHPLFGPESARHGIKGLKIAICPIRGTSHRPLARYLRKSLGLEVIMTTPHDHDREAATVQGLTHLIAKVLMAMGPLPTRMTTRSFDLLIEAISMVQNDAPEVFEAIEKANPYAPEVRTRFLTLATALSRDVTPDRPQARQMPGAGIAPGFGNAL